jgi:hypothetical protein
VKSQSVFAVLLTLVVLAASAAADKFPEPTGFGKVKFGMSVAEARKLYPKLQPTKGTEEAVAKGEQPQLVLIYEMDNQSVGPLTRCQVQLRFFTGELYEVGVRCPDRAKVGQYLQKTYGEPTKSTQNAVFWMGQRSSVSLAPRNGAFGFSDNKRLQAMQSMLFAQLQKMGAGETPAAAAPGATPAPPEAPAGAPQQ